MSELADHRFGVARHSIRASDGSLVGVQTLKWGARLTASGNQRWFWGEGPPGSVEGSKQGDRYVDTLTGSVYQSEAET
jgi:hypothetical protein